MGTVLRKEGQSKKTTPRRVYALPAEERQGANKSKAQ